MFFENESNILLFLFSLAPLWGILEVSEFMQDLQCLATNVLNQFHFWVDLYESLMQNKVKNYRVPHIRLQNSLLSNLGVHSAHRVSSHLNFTRKKTWNANVVCFYWKILNGNPEKLIITVKRVLYSSYNMHIGVKSFLNLNFNL